jgi:glycosyltransferase involved in cell wall biosynthesis
MLSVIIPTRNRSEYLRRTLASLSLQSISQTEFEVIVVDNAPSEDTAAITASFQNTVVNLRYVVEPAPGLHNARHKGMREARWDFLVYIDDDIEACPGWMEGIWHGFTRHDAALVGGKNLPKWEKEPPQWLKSLWEKSLDGERSVGYLSILELGDSEKYIDPTRVWGCNFSIRRSVLLKSGGFHPDSMPEKLLHLRGDGETHVARFIASRGYKSMYVPSASVYHFVSRERMTVEYFRKRAFNQGISDSYTRLRNNPISVDNAIITSHPLAKFMTNTWLRRFGRFVIPSSIYITANVNEAYWRGFRWHESCFLTDESVRNWVLKDSYLDV